ncbi:Pre-mRNA-splicing factor sap145 [Golovinomyces cichoracearum]|uniref:Pre-mRNA-splicing factor sap145 n=1 Tax=Golovinomyces cichoracearum TaxID=62708 RepID=A0A420ICV9_9PEZI|nr:Pre-mRNA-splicing factor sap145 [Golovinomyces cichoracearum]
MAPKMTKNQMRRMKKKEEKKKALINQPPEVKEVQVSEDPPAPISEIDDQQLEIETFEVSEDDPNFNMYKEIIERFTAAREENDNVKDSNIADKGEVFYDDDNDIPDEEDESEKEIKLSKKKKKERDKLSVAELKALVKKPELVEWTDTSASDPRLLVHIKSYRNVVPVPAHWALKREYLSSKRGVEKPPFSLPKFIKETGIAEMRDAVLEKQNEASLKQKQRERVQPKMGKLDIDYQKLYEAFFRFQTKPELTRYGEVYYEGKEYETNLRHLRPGELSEELKEALNIPPGAPPPWLINQQRFGPPPSYPSLKIPGLNAPPPPGCAWGFHPGGYGKPPVDEFNRPLYGGDIFGVLQPQVNTQPGEPVERTLWGELQAPEEDSEEEDSDEEEEETEEVDVGAGIQTPSGLETPGGLVSAVPSEYPGDMSVGGNFDLRKQKRGTDTEESSRPRSVYTVIPERQIRAEGFFGGERAYDVRAAERAQIPVLGQDESKRSRKRPGDVDVTLDPDVLQADDGISKEEVRRRFEAQKKEEKGSWAFDEDLSDMIAQESRKRQKREDEKKSEKNERREKPYRF